MTASALSLEGFRELIDRFGGDLASWPARDRTAADTLLAHSPEAHALLAEARRLDAELAATAQAPPDWPTASSPPPWASPPTSARTEPPRVFSARFAHPGRISDSHAA